MLNAELEEHLQNDASAPVNGSADRFNDSITMKIYINGRYLAQQMTGVQRYSHELVKGIDTHADFVRRFRVTVLAPARGNLLEPGFQNIPVRRVGTTRGHAWEQLELPRYSADGMLFCPGNTAPLSRLLAGRPTVVTLHSLAYKVVPSSYALSFRLLYGLLIPVVLRRARTVITVSRSEADVILSNYPHVRPRLVTIQNGGFGTSAASEITSIPPKAIGFPYGLYVGSLNAAKNSSALLEAAQESLRETGTGFVFIGGTQAAFRRESFEPSSNAKGKIVFAGQINDFRELIAWYKGAQFAALPSLYEASPFPPIEAMSCGCPVITSSIPAMRERCGPAALYCDPRNVRDIASAMITLARDGGLRAKLAALGLQQAAQYSWPRCAATTLEVLEQIAIERSGG